MKIETVELESRIYLFILLACPLIFAGNYGSAWQLIFAEPPFALNITLILLWLFAKRIDILAKKVEGRATMVLLAHAWLFVFLH